MAHYTSYHDIWTTFNSAFAFQSRAKAVKVHSQLATDQQGNQTANDYFMRIKKLTDDLAIAGQAMKYDAIITYLLASLGSEYDTLVATISQKMTTSLWKRRIPCYSLVKLVSNTTIS